MTDLRQPATAQDIAEIIGELDPVVVTEILGTSATAAEVLEAFTWVTADDQIGVEAERGPRGAVLRVCEILERERPQPDED